MIMNIIVDINSGFQGVLRRRMYATTLLQTFTTACIDLNEEKQMNERMHKRKIHQNFNFKILTEILICFL